MLTKVTLPLIGVITAFYLILPLEGRAQRSVVSTGVSRLAGTDDATRIEYVRLFLEGTLLPPAGSGPVSKASLPDADAGSTGSASGPSAGVAAGPTLIAQCTRSASGKLGFELLANFGGVDDLAYYPPWRPGNGRDLFPPQLQKAVITMEFLGYTHVKPVKRQWEALQQPVGQYRYNPPSGGSTNMEDSTYYLRFLLALPTLHLTLTGRTAEFLTTPLLDQVRKEPLCKAALL